MPPVLTGILTSPHSETIPRRDEVCWLWSQQGPSWGPAVSPQTDSPWGMTQKESITGQLGVRPEALLHHFGGAMRAQLGYTEQTGSILQFLLTLPNSWGPYEGLGDSPWVPQAVLPVARPIPLEGVGPGRRVLLEGGGGGGVLVAACGI